MEYIEKRIKGARGDALKQKTHMGKRGTKEVIMEDVDEERRTKLRVEDGPAYAHDEGEAAQQLCQAQ